MNGFTPSFNQVQVGGHGPVALRRTEIGVWEAVEEPEIRITITSRIYAYTLNFYPRERARRTESRRSCASRASAAQLSGPLLTLLPFC